MSREIREISSMNARIKGSRTIILGAGFSAAAGIPLTGALLKVAMDIFSRECPGVFSRVDGYARDCFQIPEVETVDYSVVSLSELCTFLEYIELREFGGGERFKTSGSREKLCLKFYLAKAVMQATPTVESLPAMYVEFARELHETDFVLTFNWDPLLEIALDSIGKTYSYNFDNSQCVKLCKLHGSINWRLDDSELFKPENRRLMWNSMGFAEGMLETEIYHSPQLLQRAFWASCQSLSEVEPFLVLPGYGKAFDVRSNAVLWYKPEWAFAFTHDVFIIGLSLAPDDFFIRSFFLSNLPHLESYSGVSGRRIHIVNPDSNALANYDFVLSSGLAVLHQEPFGSKHIELMRHHRVAA
tara:strand:+ start:3858 stop:4928 length:1071 start_codon:yes stop_codon:yes gene_type:complete